MIYRLDGKVEIVASVELLDDGRMRIHSAYAVGIELPIPADGQVQDSNFDWVELGEGEAERISYGLLSIRADSVSVDHDDVVSTGEAPRV